MDGNEGRDFKAGERIGGKGKVHIPSNVGSGSTPLTVSDMFTSLVVRSLEFGTNRKPRCE